MIRERTVVHQKVTWLEYSRDDVPTIYLMTPERADDCRETVSDTARWRCIKRMAFSKRKKKEDE